MSFRALLFRLLSLALALAAIFVATRGLIRALPGDPLDTLIGESGTPVPADTLRAELRLDRPFWSATAEDAAAALRGDFGLSILSRRPIAPLVADRFSRTLALGAFSVFLALALAIPIGARAAGMPGGAADRFCSGYGAVVAALPTPWIGPILLALFSLWIPVFPVSDGLALPALTLALGFSGLWSRLVRERVRESLARGAAPGARARGLSEWRVLLKYGLLPVAGPLVAYLGTQLGGVLAGSVVIEVIFDRRGLGGLLVDSVLRRDYPLVEACVFVAAAASLAGTLLGDWGQNLLDPRLNRPADPRPRSGRA